MQGMFGARTMGKNHQCCKSTTGPLQTDRQTGMKIPSIDHQRTGFTHQQVGTTLKILWGLMPWKPPFLIYVPAVQSTVQHNVSIHIGNSQTLMNMHLGNSLSALNINSSCETETRV